MVRGRTALLLGPVLALAVLALWPLAAGAHDERPSRFPDGTGRVPAYRSAGPQLLVCKDDRADFERRIAGFSAELRERNLALFRQCTQNGYRHLQEAVDDVQAPGTNILLLPGLYQEEPSLAQPSDACAHLQARRAPAGHQILSYDQQKACPQSQNLVAILGVRELQIEGTGQKPEDVVVDAQFQKLNAIRADRADGVYFRNFTAQRATFNAIYVMESDGFVIDRVVGRWTDEYGFLTFASDHGLYTDCEAYGNGDSGLYPGSASDVNRSRGDDVSRYAIEIRRCRSHHNLLGYSGTAGNSVWVHDNELFANAAGASMDSAFPNHPGLPQDHALFERNRIHGNNENYYRFVEDGTCRRQHASRRVEQGVVCPAAGVPVGTGVLTAGGNYNVFRNNWVYDHRRAGFLLFWVPAVVRSENDLGLQADTSHHNVYLANSLGRSPEGRWMPNGVDFWWDGQGTGNCWQPSASGSDPAILPGCGQRLGPSRLVSDPPKLASLLVCGNYDLLSGSIPPLCDWYGDRPLTTDKLLVAAQAVVLIPLAVLLWLRVRQPGSTGTADATTLGVLGALLPAPVGLPLLAVWWLGLGLRMRHLWPALGWTTLALSALTLAEAVDRSFAQVPLLPVPPAWLRTLVTVVWVVWAGLALALPALLRRRPA